jgi:hypothetical protein
LKRLKKTAIFLSLVPVLAAGCVDINDTRVQVTPPGQVEQYQRSPLDKCPVHKYPHRLILGQVAPGSPLFQSGNSLGINDQPTFDNCWNGVSPQLDENKVPSYSLKPIINWDQESAYVIMMGVDNTCDSIKPYQDEMTTDCFDITILLYRERQGQDCQPVNSYPVFIYIYPKTAWPIGTQWFYPTPTVTPVPSATPTVTPTVTPTPVNADE